MKTLFLCLLISTNIVAQNVINPYENYVGDEIPSYTVPSSNYTHSINFGGSTPYNGEYLTNFGELWWFTKPEFQGQAKSVKLEMVGFPFLMNCIYSSTTSCGDGSTTTRILEMPNYSVVNEQWGSNVWRTKYFDLQITGSNGTGTRGVLVTNGFNQNNPPSQSVVASPWPFFPHTSHKFTLYYHCGSTINDNIVDSLVFIYDHTRGRMRDYPFMPENSFGYGQEAWDVRFFARLVYKEIGHSYQETTNDDIYINGTTLNYFKLPSNPNLCLNYIDETFYFYLNPDGFLFIHPAPYVLPTFQLYGGSSRNTLAGYDLDNVPIQPVYTLNQGIRHTYTIQNNYDITEINPVEKIINNSSEVDITAIDLHFPSGYTFKTIRGVYPILSEVALSMGADGNYHDLRDVPVFTDLTDGYIDDFTNDNPTRSSRYYIKPGAKLTIEPCVTIYDAVFILQGNAELVFQDRQSTYGRFEVFKEDSQFGTQNFTDQQGNIANYKLIDKQGMVTRPVSLVPQGNTFLFESNDLIESGVQQIPANVPQTIAAETHVVFVAENEIKLSPGFHAAASHSPSGQSVFHALIWPSHCAGSGNRLMASNTNSQTNYQPQKFLYPTNPVLQPNPSRNNSRLHFSVLEDSKVSVKLYNAMGQLVNTPLYQNMKEKGNHIVEIKTEGLQPGIYLCTLYTEVDGSKKPMQVSRKLVVE